MINNKKLTLSIVIPVFNEEDYLADCLDSITAQSELPDEVIVVDNNSSDRSMAIAKEYPFVKIISEKKQHQAFAQKKGFDYSSSEILGRIDADCVLPKDWVKKVKLSFAADPKTAAVTGGLYPTEIFFVQTARLLFYLYHIRLPKLVIGHHMLYGSNSAFRRSAWRKISRHVLQRPDIWEDYDLSFCLNDYGRITFLDGIEVQASLRTVRHSLLWLYRYQYRGIRTVFLRAPFQRALIYAAIYNTLIIPYILPYFLDNARYLLTKKIMEKRPAAENYSASGRSLNPKTID
ncbi:MAG: glycosyltransferase family 2 protein [Candidatus Saccharimonadales bacterium]